MLEFSPALRRFIRNHERAGFFEAALIHYIVIIEPTLCVIDYIMYAVEWIGKL